MQNNKYLTLFCVALILVMGFIKNLEVSGDSQRDRLENTRIEPAEDTRPRDIDGNILIKDDEGKSITVKKDSEAKLVPKPYISAEAYLVGNLETGEIYLSQKSSQVFPIASVSKIYTALVVHHLFNLEESITVTQEMLDTYGDAGHLILNEQFTSADLLYPLLIESSNDAAEAYARHFGYDAFMQCMNGFAGEIGMNNTHFRDASGLSPSNVSNAGDLFALARYLYANEKDILEISHMPEMSLPKTDEHEAHTFVNINPYSKSASFIGGKTGRTDYAKEAMVSLFNHEANGTRYPIAVIVLRSAIGEREIDTEKLLGKFANVIMGIR